MLVSNVFIEGLMLGSNVFIEGIMLGSNVFTEGLMLGSNVFIEGPMLGSNCMPLVYTTIKNMNISKTINYLRNKTYIPVFYRGNN